MGRHQKTYGQKQSRKVRTIMLFFPPPNVSSFNGGSKLGLSSMDNNAHEEPPNNQYCQLLDGLQLPLSDGYSLMMQAGAPNIAGMQAPSDFP